jgi:predicted DNA-binding protein (UPF0251 family)
MLATWIGTPTTTLIPTLMGTHATRVPEEPVAFVLVRRSAGRGNVHKPRMTPLRYVGVRPIDPLPVDGPPSSARSGALGRLTPDDRELLTLVAWDGLRVDQAAAILNISAAAARQRLVRARRRLRTELDTAPDATTGSGGPPTFTPTNTWPRSASSGSRFVRREDP